MGVTVAGSTSESVPDRLVRATIGLLADQGPSAIKARTVAAATGLSTMVVYSHFGGIPELIRAVVEHGFKELDKEFSRIPVTADPVADLFMMALVCRRVARANPHLYDLMFGLSTRSTYRPMGDSDLRLSGRSSAFRESYAHMLAASARLVDSGRIEPREPAVVTAQLWSFVHGYITLELAEHFADFDDAVSEVMLPMGVNLTVGLGDERERATASHAVALRGYESRSEMGDRGGVG